MTDIITNTSYNYIISYFNVVKSLITKLKLDIQYYIFG